MFVKNNPNQKHKFMKSMKQTKQQTDKNIGGDGKQQPLAPLLPCVSGLRLRAEAREKESIFMCLFVCMYTHIYIYIYTYMYVHRLAFAASLALLFCRSLALFLARSLSLPLSLFLNMYRYIYLINSSFTSRPSVTQI